MIPTTEQKKTNRVHDTGVLGLARVSLKWFNWFKWFNWLKGLNSLNSLTHSTHSTTSSPPAGDSLWGTLPFPNPCGHSRSSFLFARLQAMKVRPAFLQSRTRDEWERCDGRTNGMHDIKPRMATMRQRQYRGTSRLRSSQTGSPKTPSPLAGEDAVRGIRLTPHRQSFIQPFVLFRIDPNGFTTPNGVASLRARASQT